MLKLLIAIQKRGGVLALYLPKFQRICISVKENTRSSIVQQDLEISRAGTVLEIRLGEYSPIAAAAVSRNISLRSIVLVIEKVTKYGALPLLPELPKPYFQQGPEYIKERSSILREASGHLRSVRACGVSFVTFATATCVVSQGPEIGKPLIPG